MVESTIWMRQVKQSGPAGLVHERPPWRHVLDRVSHRWLETARSGLKGHEKPSRPVRNLVLIEIEESLANEFPPADASSIIARR
ncbi:hypothetical protein ABZ208_23590 [Streptomyces sp. NPDC006208]|uniref:hypothetical protein n=1 Tax=Streptomyces sp. NPDC006208 TaxID=3156734 RepID=UPI0033BB1092